MGSAITLVAVSRRTIPNMPKRMLRTTIRFLVRVGRSDLDICSPLLETRASLDSPVDFSDGCTMYTCSQLGLGLAPLSEDGQVLLDDTVSIRHECELA